MRWLSDIDIFQQTQNTDDSKISLPLLNVFYFFRMTRVVKSNEVYFSVRTKTRKQNISRLHANGPFYHTAPL